MTHILNISQDNPVIHIKAYGGVVIRGEDQDEVQCEIEAPQLATLMEEGGHVYITANSSCELTVPENSSIDMEKGMGSVSISNVKNKIEIEKVLGNLVLVDVNTANIERVGGNCSVKNATGRIYLEKINGHLVVDGVESFHCEKVGGNAIVQGVMGNFYLTKTAGNFKAENIPGSMQFERANGSIIARSVKVTGDLRADGNLRLINVDFADDIDLRAGGDIVVQVPEDFPGATLDLHSGGQKITLKAKDVDMQVNDQLLEYQLGSSKRDLFASAGGDISFLEGFDPDEEIIGDVSSYFTFEESALSELIRERVQSATRRADAKVRITEKRLEQMQDRVEKLRGFNLNLDVGGKKYSFTSDDTTPPIPPVPPVTRPIGKKGASDEERLMILKMLQDKKITVDEAESLFKALEE
jgi:hypothetical protein